MPMAGELEQMGFQCGQLWGAALAAGAEAYRLFGPGPRAEARPADAQALGALDGLRRWRIEVKEQAARTEAESRYRALVERMPAVLYTWDPRKPTGTACQSARAPQPAAPRPCSG